MSQYLYASWDSLGVLFLGEKLARSASPGTPVARVVRMEDATRVDPLASAAFVEHLKALHAWIHRAQHAIDQVEGHLACLEAQGATHNAPEVRSLFAATHDFERDQ